ncbi:glycosyltransferase family 2 protein [Confluentibacter citreus]|uniref:glycosyltransferase family 2 protein n=1 Tax=Confluentibacter citreus TaxID=2007307 RepID=UPI000C28F0FA|nr:glycosyltransferase family 2 protein [Confluentibacter citreus]
MQALISIIIPTYNRAHLIKETLDSILEQTYKNWECIVVDDGSTDTSDAVLDAYVKQDSRFRKFKRPNNKPKGANACRNIGLEQAQGDFVVFFDSDDLMTPNHLEIKHAGIKTNHCDFVITRTKYFNADNSIIDKYYAFDKHKITPHNYIVQKINWLTYDILVKTSLAKEIRFNENLQSGQEYNYFSKLTLLSTNAIFIDEVVTLRRYHDTSIRSQLKTKRDLNERYFRVFWFTYLDIKKAADKKTRLFLLRACLKLTCKEQQILVKEKSLFYLYVIRELGVRGLFLGIMLLSYRVFGRGYIFRKQLFKAFYELP